VESSKVQFFGGKISLPYQMRKDNFLLVLTGARGGMANAAIKLRSGIIRRLGKEKPARAKLRAGL
jgi:hypothetical protein